MTRGRYLGRGPLVSCKGCGRDTKAKFGFCFKCQGGGGNSHAKTKYKEPLPGMYFENERVITPAERSDSQYDGNELEEDYDE